MPPDGSAECAKRRAGMRMRYSQVEAGDGEGLAESTAQVPQSWPPAGRLVLRSRARGVEGQGGGIRGGGTFRFFAALISPRLAGED